MRVEIRNKMQNIYLIYVEEGDDFIVTELMAVLSRKPMSTHQLRVGNSLKKIKVRARTHTPWVLSHTQIYKFLDTALGCLHWASLLTFDFLPATATPVTEYGNWRYITFIGKTCAKQNLKPIKWDYTANALD